MQTIELSRIVRSIHERNPSSLTKDITDGVMRILQTHLLCGDEFYSVDSFRPIRNINMVAMELTNRGRVFVEPHEGRGEESND